MRKITAPKSVLSMWITSYLLVLILPLFSSQLLFWGASSIVEKNAESFSRASLNQTVASLDRIAEDICAMGQELVSRQEVESLLYVDLPLSNVKREKVRDLQKEMITRCAYNKYISDVYLLFTRSGIVASTKGYYREADIFSSMLKRDYGFSAEDLISWTSENGGFLIKMLGGGEEAQKLVAFMAASSTSRSPEAIIVFSLDIGQLRKVLESRPDSSGRTPQFWAVSEEGTTLSTASSRNFAESIAAGTLDSSVVFKTEEGESMVLSTMRSGISGWTLVSATLLQEYTAQLSQIRLWYFIYLGICIALGIGVSVFFARRNYTPVRRLSEMLRQNMNQSPVEGEFAQLEEGLSSLLKKSQDYEKEIDKQKKSLRQASMTRMLRGSLHSDQAFEAACADYDLSFSTKQFGVVGILIRDYSNLFLEGKADESDETLELVYFVVTSVTEELLREQSDAYICQSDGNLYAILSPKEPLTAENIPEFVGKVREICRKAETFIRERLGILTAFYVTSIYTSRKSGMRGIHSAYEEAQWGIEQMEGFRMETVVNSREDMREKAPILPSSALSDSDSRRRQFSAAVIAGDFDEVDALYLALRSEGIAQVEKSFSSMRVQTIFLLDYLVSNLDSGQLERCQPQVEAFLGRLREARHDDELSEVIHEAAVCIHEVIKKSSEDENNSAGLEIARYINGHYQEPDISVASIADHFGVSQSYLLRQFKKCSAGQGGVLDYIHQRRVDTAKILLREGDDTVEHIAAAVGYGNALALIRAFKRLEGTTPTAYRRVTAGSK